MAGWRCGSGGKRADAPRPAPRQAAMQRQRCGGGSQAWPLWAPASRRRPLGPGGWPAAADSASGRCRREAPHASLFRTTRCRRISPTSPSTDPGAADLESPAAQNFPASPRQAVQPEASDHPSSAAAHRWPAGAAVSDAPSPRQRRSLTADLLLATSGALTTNPPASPTLARPRIPRPAPARATTWLHQPTSPLSDSTLASGGPGSAQWLLLDP